MAETLDRNSFIPLYCQISDSIRVMIEQGALSSGDRVPSENELVALYNVSRNTVRLAINSLISDGLVYRVQGKGTFVAALRMRYGLLHMSCFTEDMLQRGLKPGSLMLNFSQELPSQKVVETLDLKSEDHVYRIERLRLADDQPMALNVSYIPVHFCPDLVFDADSLVDGSLYALLENKYQLNLGYADYVIKTAIATEREASLLEVPVNSTLMFREGITHLENGTPIEYTKLFNRADRFEFSFRAVRHQKPDSSKVD